MQLTDAIKLEISVKNKFNRPQTVNIVKMGKTLFFLCCIWLVISPRFVYSDVYNLVLGNQYNIYQPEGQEVCTTTPSDAESLQFEQNLEKEKLPERKCVFENPDNSFLIEALNLCNNENPTEVQLPENSNNPETQDIDLSPISDPMQNNINDNQEVISWPKLIQDNSSWMKIFQDILNGLKVNSTKPGSLEIDLPSFYDLFLINIQDDQQMPSQENPSWMQIVMQILNESKNNPDKPSWGANNQDNASLLPKIQQILKWIEDNQDNPSWPQVYPGFPQMNLEMPCWLMEHQCEEGTNIVGNWQSTYDFKWNFRLPESWVHPRTTEEPIAIPTIKTSIAPETTTTTTAATTTTTIATTTDTTTTATTTTEATTVTTVEDITSPSFYSTHSTSTRAPMLLGCVDDCP